MGKYVKTFIGTLVMSFFIFMFGNGFFSGGGYLQATILSLGTVIILLLTTLITQVRYLIDLLKDE
ncbi:hypothetical protein GLW08_12315 [Pontibacillus yanchengensis]|uniref:Uncharacterized protein n=2 Tax=Pontibacillus yanchengensis TaxID=462910 RepID=A0ACC7VH59_9BACI|nr:hypothetical protein [Pontibacillus yanchengensis]MYL33608.1 hypothetical protein [Pontibacillus yanchengensis]MYL54122.1 hypothetical protein [Pontibacillus yanchengensis]